MMEFEQIYDAYFHDVFRYIRRLSNSERIAEEITAETFFKAMHSIDSFSGNCALRVWLCQIAKNSYLSYLKKAGRADRIEDTELLRMPDPNETIEEQLARHDEAVQVQRLLHDIPEPYKEVFMWRVFAELIFKEIGQIFGRSENWACVTYHRARNKIKERLEEQEHEK